MNVLFVNVSVVALPTSVSVVEGRVRMILEAMAEAGDFRLIEYVDASLKNNPVVKSMDLLDNVIVFVLVATMVVSMLSALPFFTRGDVTVICPAPLN